jgi:hypothetical protein
MEEAMGARKKRRFISKAFVDSSDESDLDEQSMLVESNQKVREDDEGGDSEEWRVQDQTVTMSENSSMDSDDSGMESTVDPKQSSKEEPLSVDTKQANGTQIALLPLESEGKQSDNENSSVVHGQDSGANSI